MPKFDEVVVSLINDGYEVDSTTIRMDEANTRFTCDFCKVSGCVNDEYRMLQFMVGTFMHHVCADRAACHKRVSDAKKAKEDAEAERISEVERCVVL